MTHPPSSVTPIPFFCGLDRSLPLPLGLRLDRQCTLSIIRQLFRSPKITYTYSFLVVSDSSPSTSPLSSSRNGLVSERLYHSHHHRDLNATVLHAILRLPSLAIVEENGPLQGSVRPKGHEHGQRHWRPLCAGDCLYRYGEFRPVITRR